MQRITPHSRWRLQCINWRSARFNPFSFLNRKNSRHEIIILLSPYKLPNKLPLFKTHDVDHWKSTQHRNFYLPTVKNKKMEDGRIGGGNDSSAICFIALKLCTIFGRRKTCLLRYKFCVTQNNNKAVWRFSGGFQTESGNDTPFELGTWNSAYRSSTNMPYLPVKY